MAAHSPPSISVASSLSDAPHQYSISREDIPLTPLTPAVRFDIGGEIKIHECNEPVQLEVAEPFSIPTARTKLRTYVESSEAPQVQKDIAKLALEILDHRHFKPRDIHKDLRPSVVAHLVAQLPIAILNKQSSVTSDALLQEFKKTLLSIFDDLSKLDLHAYADNAADLRPTFHDFKGKSKTKLARWYGEYNLKLPKELGQCRCRCHPDCNCNCRCKCSCRCRRECDRKCGGSNPKHRNLVVSIDGTSNQFGSNNTNVVELHSRIVKDTREVQQLTYYNSGIGTYAPTSQRSVSLLQRLSSKIDLAFAMNFEKIVQGAYRWLADHYEPGDQIFLFGFSRGAYQVRTLAAMIKKVGLVFPGNREQIPFAYEIYSQKFKGRKATAESDEMARHFKRTFSRKIGIHFLGAWDTVSSIGIIRGPSLPLTEKPYYKCHFRHALALTLAFKDTLTSAVEFIVSAIQEHTNTEQDTWPSEILERLLLCVEQASKIDELCHDLHQPKLYDSVARLLQVRHDSGRKAGRFSLESRPDALPSPLTARKKHAQQEYGIKLLTVLAKYDNGTNIILEKNLIQELALLWNSMSGQQRLKEEIVNCVSHLIDHTAFNSAVLEAKLLELISAAISAKEINLLAVRNAVMTLLDSAHSDSDAISQIYSVLVGNIADENRRLRDLSLELLKTAFDQDRINSSHLCRELGLKLGQQPVSSRFWTLVALRSFSREERFHASIAGTTIIKYLMDILQKDPLILGAWSSWCLSDVLLSESCRREVLSTNNIKTFQRLLGTRYEGTSIESAFLELGTGVQPLAIYSLSGMVSRHDNVLTVLSLAVGNGYFWTSPSGQSVCFGLLTGMLTFNYSEAEQFVEVLVQEHVLDSVVRLLDSHDVQVLHTCVLILGNLRAYEGARKWMESQITDSTGLPGRLLERLGHKNELLQYEVVETIRKLSTSDDGDSGRKFANAAVKFIDGGLVKDLRKFDTALFTRKSDTGLVDSIAGLANNETTFSLLAESKLITILQNIIPRHPIGIAILLKIIEFEHSHARVVTPGILRALMKAAIDDSLQSSATEAVEVLKHIRGGAGPDLSSFNPWEREIWKKLAAGAVDAIDASSHRTRTTSSSRKGIYAMNPAFMRLRRSNSTTRAIPEESAQDFLPQSQLGFLNGDGTWMRTDTRDTSAGDHSQVADAIRRGITEIEELIERGRAEIGATLSSRAKVDRGVQISGRNSVASASSLDLRGSPANGTIPFADDASSNSIVITIEEAVEVLDEDFPPGMA
ncbi:hypothetical protein HGRIS_011294 [Hohenbuehelia grisea]|uniref:T6SS Phospholipase effector Tle1-like catalytic domain-containing protein n=1 Tax=Hohenbuehelia grisea TaxID=104357 RepID=A0ABR3JUM0_9AGAR